MGFLEAMLLGSFSSTLERVVALAFFMPVVFGMGGNVGSQFLDDYGAGTRNWRTR